MKPTAYVINLARRPERWQRTQELWSPWFELVRFPAVEIACDGARGCILSHEAAAVQALRDQPMAIVFEDDLVPTPHFEKIGLDCLTDAEKYCNHWDYINCGPYLDCTPIRLPRASLSPTVSPLFFQATHSQQTHFVCYNRNSLPLLQAALTSPIALDVFLGRNAKRQWVAARLLATQADGPSDIIQHTVDIHKPLLYQLTEQMLENASHL